MKIAKVTCWVLRVPVRYPLLQKDSLVKAAFAEVETDEGLKGYAMSDYAMAHGIRDFINREVAPTITGMDPLRTETVRTAMQWQLAPKLFLGAFACASSLIDIALWDIKGKVTGQPVWKLLGGARERVPAYITFGIGTYTQEQLVEVAKTLVAEGQDKLKMVVAARVNQFRAVAAAPTDEDISRDIERIRAVREAVGDAVELMIDANQSATYSQAARLAREAGPCNLTWFEDPIPQADPRLLAQLRRESPIPIATGSTGIFDLMQLREYLLNESVDYLQPNVRMIGGYTGALKAAALAQAFNVQLQMGGNWPHLNMHLHAGVPNGGRVEFHWGGWKAFAACFDGAPDPVKGWTTPPDKPGLGFTPKEGVVKELAID